MAYKYRIVLETKAHDGTVLDLYEMEAEKLASLSALFNQYIEAEVIRRTVENFDGSLAIPSNVIRFPERKKP